MIFEDSNLQSFHALYSHCCEFAVTPVILINDLRNKLCFVC